MAHKSTPADWHDDDPPRVVASDGSSLEASATETIGSPSKPRPDQLEEIRDAARQARQLGAPDDTDPDAPESCPLADSVVPHRFELLGRLGIGGFGVVYHALDRELRREVALKIPKPEILLAPQALQRFLREAHLAASLYHPNIVPIYSAESSGGFPVLVYHYCPGPTLAIWMLKQSHSISVRTAAEIVRLIAEAVHHAHSRGILHRDLKPANILLESTDPAVSNRGFAHGSDYWVPRIADFGIAKSLEEDDDKTQAGTILGTAEYMSPEQAAGRTSEVSTHSDIYALGAILHELLVGRPPLRGTSQTETRLLVINLEPRLVRSYQPNIPHAMEAIVHNCLQKAPSKRYSSAGALAEDLKRFLENRPVSVQSLSFVPRFLLWTRRHPTLAAMFAVTILAALAGLVGIGIHFNRTDKLLTQLESTNQELRHAVNHAELQERRATHTANEVSDLLYVADVQLAAHAVRQKDVREARRALTRFLESEALRSRRGFGWRFLWGQTTADSQFGTYTSQSIWSIRLSPDHKLLAVGGNRGVLQLYQNDAGFRLHRTMETSQKEINSISFSADSRMLATAGDDGSVAIWDPATGERLQHIQVFDNKIVYGVSFLDNGAREDGGQLVACGQSPDLQLLDARTGKLLDALSLPHTTTIEMLALSPDGRIATAGSDGQIVICRPRSADPPVIIKASSSRVTAVCFTLDSRLLISGDRFGAVVVWDATTGEPLLRAPHMDAIMALAVSPSHRLACTDRGGVLQLFDLATQAPPATSQEMQPFANWAVSDGSVHGLEFTKDGDSLITGAKDGSVKQWAVRQPEPIRDIALQQEGIVHFGDTMCLSSHPDEVIISSPRGLEVWNLVSGELVDHLPSLGALHSCCSLPASSPDEVTILVGDDKGRVGIVPWRPTGKKSELLKPVVAEWMTVLPQGTVAHLAVSRNGHYAAAMDHASQAVVIDLKTRSVRLKVDVANSFAFTPGGDKIVFGRRGTNDIAVYDLATMQVETIMPGHEQTIHAIAFSPDGQQMITGSDDRLLKVWDTRTWSPLATLSGHLNGIRSIAISPDGRTMASLSETLTKLWHLPSRRELFELSPREGVERGQKILFSKDGNRLITRNGPQSLTVYNGPEPALPEIRAAGEIEPSGN